jgi:hypothetical protein
MWYRIFASSSEMPDPKHLLAFLETQKVSIYGRFAADESGWYQADLRLAEVSVRLERYLAEEPGIRGELNSWAAWLETREDAHDHVRLMQGMIQTAQLFTLQCDALSASSHQICVELCRFLARSTAGVYQVDGRGLFAADGDLLVAE